MEITKDKLKRAAIGSTVFWAGSQYISAAITQDFDQFKNYQFDAFKESVTYNLSNPMFNITSALQHDLFIQSQPFLLGGSLLLAGKILFDKKKQYELAADYGAYGTSRWANDSEIYSAEDVTTNMSHEGSIVAQHKRKPIILKDESFMNKNVCVIGGSGAGKTRANIIPNILKNKLKSLVVIDPKGELFEKTSEIKREQGYDVRLINFKNRSVSDRYNLFDYIRDDADAFKIANTMVSNTGSGTSKGKNDFFDLAQTSVLQAIMIFVKYDLPKNQQHMGSVLNIAQMGLGDMQKMFYKYPEAHIVRKSFKTAVERLGDPKTASNVLISLMQTLNPWQYDEVCEFTAKNDFLFEDIGLKKMIVYVILPIADNEFKPLITTFFTQMFSELYRLADRNYGELPRKVYFALDEFANIGKIPNFEERLSTTRSLGIEVTIVLQDISQLERVYSKEISKEIINNCDTRLLLKANEVNTAKYFSQMAGKTTIKIKNQSNSSGSKSSSKSTSTSYQGRDLITPDEVTRLSKNEQLLFMTGKYPMKIKKAWFDDFKYFNKMLGKRVSRDEYPVPSREDYEAFYPQKEELPEFDLDSIFEVEEEKEKVPPNVDEETGEILEDPKEDSVDDLLNDFKL